MFDVKKLKLKLNSTGIVYIFSSLCNMHFLSLKNCIAAGMHLVLVSMGVIPVTLGGGYFLTKQFKI